MAEGSRLLQCFYGVLQWGISANYSWVKSDGFVQEREIATVTAADNAEEDSEHQQQKVLTVW